MDGVHVEEVKTA